MTRQTFYRNLRRIAPNFRWKITQHGCIRAYKGSTTYCPITAVARVKSNKYFDILDVGLAANILGLNSKDEFFIELSADSPYSLNDYYLLCRKALLKSVGLQKS